ncbi:hypothetical protein [Bradyrhizobium sp. Bra78]|uniref:hypothetical protein n=1 Tax=Bradyrhizobium sp. Bra78 TaxID=2926010 RepID=UPI0021C676DA|nr:hypothetical protein [Bradyrhizobium sp. Bra78]
MTEILTYLLSSIPQIAGNAKLVAQGVSAMVALYPIARAEFQDLQPIVKNAIAAFRSDPATMPATLDQLDAFEAKLDADYEEAAALAAAEDAKFAGA